MEHLYTRRVPIRAEQFDGSQDMMKKYEITDDGMFGNFTFRKDHSCLPLKVGWWIVDYGSHEVLGLNIHEWRTMNDEKFNLKYKRID